MYPLSANCIRCSVSAAPHGYAFYVCLRFDLNENSVGGAADTEPRTQFALSGYSPKWHNTDAEETYC